MAGGYGAAADAALLMSAIVIALILAVLRTCMCRPSDWRDCPAPHAAAIRRCLLIDRVSPPTAAVLSFISGDGLSRSRLHQFVFLLIHRALAPSDRGCHSGRDRGALDHHVVWGPDSGPCSCCQSIGRQRYSGFFR